MGGKIQKDMNRWLMFLYAVNKVMLFQFLSMTDINRDVYDVGVSKQMAAGPLCLL